MAAKLSSDIIVDVIEATIRVLVDTGLTRDEALQVMLSQIAVQVSPDVMTIATKLNEKYHHDFDQAKWHAQNRKQDQPVGLSRICLWPALATGFATSPCAPDLIVNYNLARGRVNFNDLS